MSLRHALPVSHWGNCDPQASCTSCPGSLHDATRRAEDRDLLRLPRRPLFTLAQENMVCPRSYCIQDNIE